MIDIAVMEVSRDLLRNIGIQLPQTASINFQPSNANLNNTDNNHTDRHQNDDEYDLNNHQRMTA